MLSYALIEFSVGPVQLLQEAWQGRVVRYTDLDGNTVTPPASGGAHVVDANYPRPAWAVDLVDAPEATSTRHITRRAFRARFSTAEKTRIEIASVHNSALANDHPANLLAAALRAHQRDVSDGAYVDLDIAQTRGGVLQLEQVGMLDGAGRATAILDAPISRLERFVDA